MNTVWRDSNEKPIQAHGGGFISNEGRWWWYGEGVKNSVGVSAGVNAYSSQSIEGPWRFEGQVLASSEFSTLVGPIAPNSAVVVERPKVVKSASTGQFVLWCHLDVSENTAVDTWANYVYRRAGVAVADSPRGPFKPIRALRLNGLESLDINLFVDGDETYVIRACTKNQYLGITKLTPDLTQTSGNIVSVLKAKVEGPVLFRDPHDKALYVIASGVHGWEPGRMHVFRARGRAPKVEGAAWDCLEGVNPTLHPRSFFSQPTAVLTLHDAERGNKPYLVYVGDNWVFGMPHDARQGFSEMAVPPAGRFTEKYKAYIGKLLAWEHTRLPFASYVMLPLFFLNDKEHGRVPRIEFTPEWSAAAPFSSSKQASHPFGCVSGVATAVLRPSSSSSSSIGVEGAKGDTVLICKARDCGRRVGGGGGKANGHKGTAASSVKFDDDEEEEKGSDDTGGGGGSGRQVQSSFRGGRGGGGGGGLRGRSGLRAGGGGRGGGGGFTRRRRRRELLAEGGGDSSSERRFPPKTEEQKAEARDQKEHEKALQCTDDIVLKRNKVCKEMDQTGCILPLLQWDAILSGSALGLGEASGAVTHGAYKWKNPGATMWAAKQKGKDPKFWNKAKGGSSDKKQ